MDQEVGTLKQKEEQLRSPQGTHLWVTAHFTTNFYPSSTLFKDAMVLNKHLQHGKEPLKDTSGSKREGNSSLQ